MKIALIGNQNSGKTTLFNLLTGTNQKVGNWPGVTIERKEGKIKGTDITVVDLPGVYSLSPYTSEEDVSRQYIIEQKPDLVVNIVDATNLERSLYLTTQLLELDVNVLVALNMQDMLYKRGLVINIDRLSELFDTTVVQISALKNRGINDLIKVIEENRVKPNQHLQIYHAKIEEVLLKMNLDPINNRFISVKTLEDDPKYETLQTPLLQIQREELQRIYGCDINEIIANQRYEFITSVKAKCVVVSQEKESITDKIDKILLNKWAAIPIFVVIMFLIYFLAVGMVGALTVDLVDGAIGGFGDFVASWLEGMNASGWAISLIQDGVIAGVGSILNFVPQLIILFLCISLLETTGYMSRISFFFDRLFRKFGLSGKSLIPFIVGSGCSVPAIMSTRTIEDETEKRMTIMCTPFIPCSAKLPIIALFAGYFFDKYSGIVTASLYFLAIAVILISALIMKKFFFKSKSVGYISELPEYKLPSPKYIFKDVFDKTFAFIKRAGTIILMCSIIVWFLLSFNFRFEYGIDIEESMLASMGKVLSFIFYPMTGEFSWAATVSAIQGLVAKEQVVSSMNIIAGLADDASNANMLFGSGIFGFFNPASAYAFCVFNLFSAPCFGAIGAMRRELGSNKRMWQAILFQTGIAWILASLIFGIGSLIMFIF